MSRLGELGKMMKISVTMTLLGLIFFSLIVPIHASITVEGVLEQTIQVIYAIENINSTLYEEILEQGIFTNLTIPHAIETYFGEQNLENAEVDYDPAKQIFTNSTKSIHVELYLSGSDITDSTFNPAAMTKTYNVETGWRKIQVNLTDGVALNFAQYFGKSVSEWEITNYTINGEPHPTYFYDSADSAMFDPLCRFVLPANAIDIHAIKDTIIFELPIPLEDNLINSPFLVLGVLIIVNIALVAYRKMRR